MASQPVVLDSFSWPSKKAAEAAFRAILNDSGYALYQDITDPVHDRMLMEVLDRHPEAAEKRGAGVDSFFVGRTGDGDRQAVRSDAVGIWIRRLDGTTVDFSYRTAIRQESQESRVKEALRLAAESRRMAFRDARFAARSTSVSDLTGVPLSRADAQVIYLRPSWSELSSAFAVTEGGWRAIDVDSGGGGVQIGSGLTDPALEARWLDFHDRHASLGIASTSEAARRSRSVASGWAP
ncbi:DCL family protein [Agrococcus sp. Marseille-P2731]|uniref:DCL family protein n=1 Tax=Agrococcus sp. Marseille-P2731 TaxID=1841862 RepID=UPI00092FEBFF|nr:DCL family protein [Agrococcus sp. Marseille-P2731]